MRGTVLKRGNKWYCYYYTHRIIDGKHERKSKGGFVTKKEAESYLRQMIDDVEKTVYTDSKRNTVAAFLNYWLEECSCNLAPNTVRGYRVNVENHIVPVVGEIYLDKLQPKDIDVIFQKMSLQNLSGTTQLYVYAVLRKALNYAVKRRLIPVNIMNYVDSPKKDRYKPTVLSKEQLQTLQHYFYGTLYYLPIMFCMSLGLRRGEMLGIKWCDIDFNNKTIHIQRSVTPIKGGIDASKTKTDKSNRFLVIPDFLFLELKNRYDSLQAVDSEAENLYINVTEDNNVISASILQKAFKKALKECSLPDIRIHDLRHSWATLMLSNNVPTKVASEMLGHSGIGITLDIYTHVLTEMQTHAIDVVSDVFK